MLAIYKIHTSFNFYATEFMKICNMKQYTDGLTMVLTFLNI